MDDSEATQSGDFVFGDDDTNPGRRAVSREELLERLTAMIQACEGCEQVRVIDVARLDWPDKDGRNWSRSIVLDPAGVQPEVYSLAYAEVIGTAHDTWNLK